MTEKTENLSFEEALQGLEESVSRLRSSDISLEDSMKGFETGMGYYGECVRLLNEAKGKIQIYAKEADSLEDFPL